MCIFAQPVDSVTDTNIFARLLPGGWQSLVYQMDFASQAKNAIILPIPVQLPASEEDSLQFISLKEYDTFFADLNRLFPVSLPDRPMSRSSRGMETDSAVKTLRVQEVGDFVASFVPTLSDFDRLDQQFRLPQESWDQIPAYTNYGFAVFQLKSLNGKPHPMAFKFKSQLQITQPKSVFFPTVHIHDGEVHDRERFDHTLYLQSPDFDQACGRYIQSGRHVPDSATGYTRSKWAAAHSCDLKKAQGILDAQGLVHRQEMRGTFKNTDVVVNCKSPMKNAGIPTTNQSLAALAAAGGFAGMKWFFDRRERVAQQEGV